MGMTILLDQDVVEEAIISHITGEGINTHNKKIEVTITSGRQGNGCKAEITLTTIPEVSAPTVEPLKEVKAETPEPVVEEPLEVPLEETSELKGNLFKNAP